MNKEQKQEVIEALKDKFTQYSNFYVTNTESLSVAQVTNLRRHCFNKQVEMKVAKNTLIKKALESLDNDKYSGVYDSLHQVTALMFSDSPKEPALIISSFRKELNAEKPVLKAAFLNGDIFVGDNQLVNLTKIKTKNELIGEVIGLLMSPIQRVIGALENKHEASGIETPGASAEAVAKAETPKSEVSETSKAETKADTSKAEVVTTPTAETKAAAPKSEATEALKADIKADTSKTEVATTPTAETKAAAPKSEVAEAPKAETKADTSKTEASTAPTAETKAAAPKSEVTEAPKAETKANTSKTEASTTPTAETKAAASKSEATEAPKTEATETPKAETKIEITKSEVEESPTGESTEDSKKPAADSKGSKSESE